MTDLSVPLDHFTKRARELQSRVRAGDPDACARVRAVFSDASAKPDHELADLELMRAQHVVAVEHGFADWKALKDAPGVEARLAITMRRHPELTDHGIGIYRENQNKSAAELAAIYADNRRDLRASAPAVATAVAWLRENVTPTRTMNQHRTSYGIKHEAEDDIGYVTNGVFIAAGMIAGYPYKIEPGSPNVLFGMSEKSFKEIAERRTSPERQLKRFTQYAIGVLAKRGVRAFPVGHSGVELAWRDDGTVRTLKISTISTWPFIVRLYVDYYMLHISQKVAKELDIATTIYTQAEPNRPGSKINILLDEVEPALEWALNFDARVKEDESLPPFKVAGPYRWRYVWSERASARYVVRAERPKARRTVA